MHLEAISEWCGDMSLRAAISLPVLIVLGAPVADARDVCTLVIDAPSGATLISRGSCLRRVTPASTFKIAISLMGYDSGFLIDQHDPALPFHKGYPDWIPAWRHTTDPTRWIADSVVWYSQQVTRFLGTERFARYTLEFQYGNADVSGDPGKDNGLTHAWLSSSLQISPKEQVSFLRNLVLRHLPVSERAYDMTGRITRVALLATGWAVHGKTGTGFPRKENGSTDRDHELGWFVGWATKGPRSVVFAYLIQDEKSKPTNAGLRARDAFLRELPRLLVRITGP